jgi:hypothetical protein
MPSAQATITWGEGLAAVLTLGMITFLLCMYAREGKPSAEHRAKAGETPIHTPCHVWQRRRVTNDAPTDNQHDLAARSRSSPERHRGGGQAAASTRTPV